MENPSKIAIRSSEFVKGAVKWEHLPRDGRPEVVFVGRSNVGKSSLINMLLARKRLARTSGQPGKTQELNYYLINGDFYLVDLPGYGYAKVSKKERKRWQKLIDQYLTFREPLRAVFHLVDSRHPPTELDREVLEMMLGQRVPYIIALTKTDKLSGNGRAKAERRMKEALSEYGLEAPVVLTSAETGRGRDDLLSWMGSFVT